MKKTPLVFEMDYDTETITSNVKNGSEWVVNGEGIATIKFDGTAARFFDGKLWKRYDRKLNKDAFNRKQKGEVVGLDISDYKTPPAGFEPCEDKPDPVTGHWPGWVPVSRDEPADKSFFDALDRGFAGKEGQTYELVGPSYALNVYGLDHHELWEHGKDVVDFPDRSLEAFRKFMENNNVEGLVFHHPDGRMAKIRKKDFDIFWVQEDMRKNRKKNKKFGR